MDDAWASRDSRWVRLLDAWRDGGGGRALPEDLVEAGLWPVGVQSLGNGRGRAVCADVGVLDSCGVAERGVPREESRGGGVHSSFSTRLMGLCRERIDWTGGAEYFAGIGGGGLGGGDSGRAWCVVLVATVLQLKRLFGGSKSACGRDGLGFAFRVAIVSIDCLPGATEGAYVVQLKWLVGCRSRSASLWSIIPSSTSLAWPGLRGGEAGGG